MCGYRDRYALSATVAHQDPECLLISENGRQQRRKAYKPASIRLYRTPEQMRLINTQPRAGRRDRRPLQAKPRQAPEVGARGSLASSEGAFLRHPVRPGRTHNGTPVAHRKRRRRDAAAGESTFVSPSIPAAASKADSGLTIKMAGVDLDY